MTEAQRLRPRRSTLERELADLLVAEGDVPAWVEQAPLVPGRRYRADFAWPEARLAVECQGGIWAGGRHTRGAGYEADCERLCLATLAGWRVLYVTEAQIADGRAVRWVREALGLGPSRWERRVAQGLERERER